MLLLAPLSVLAMVGPAQHFRVGQIQLLEFVQILAGGGGLELDHIAVFVYKVGKTVAATSGGAGVTLVNAAAAVGAATGGRIAKALAIALRGVWRWRVDATVVDGHRVSVPFVGYGRSCGSADCGGGVSSRAAHRFIRVPRAERAASLLASAGIHPRRSWQSNRRIRTIHAVRS